VIAESAHPLYAVVSGSQAAVEPEPVEEGRLECGGEFVDGVHFQSYEGGQVRSLLSLVICLGSGDYRDRYLDVRIPPTNVRDSQLQTAREFGDGLANHLLATGGKRA
jgi:hypothetical protein